MRYLKERQNLLANVTSVYSHIAETISLLVDLARFQSEV
jgi:hypothetical protein